MPAAEEGRAVARGGAARASAASAARFLAGSSRADFGVSGILVLSTTFILLMSFLLFAAGETSILRDELISAGFHNPKFFEDGRAVSGYDAAPGYSEPTSNLVTFELMRHGVFLAGAVAVFGYVLFTAWAEAAGIWPRGSTRPLFLRFVGMLVLVSVFVPAWDAAAVESERFAVLLLNPLHELEPHGGPGRGGGGAAGEGDAAPDGCIAGVYEGPLRQGAGGGAGRRDPAARDTRASYGVSPSADPLLALVAGQNLRLRDAVSGEQDMSPCDPRLRVSYVYHKAFWGATDGVQEARTGVEQAFGMLESLAEHVGSGVFMGMTKVMALFSLTLLGMVVMTLRELFLALVISLLPMLCILSFAPRVGGIFSRMLESIVPLLLIPVMTAAVLFTGAGILLDMDDGRHSGGSLLTFWIAAMSLLILATAVPLMMAPILAGLVGQASSMAGTAVLSGAMGAMSVAQGAGRGAVSGYREGGMRGGLAGLGGGLQSGASAGMLQDVSIGLGTVPGAGAMGSPFARHAAAVAERPHHLAAAAGPHGAGEAPAGLVGPAGAPLARAPSAGGARAERIAGGGGSGGAAGGGSMPPPGLSRDAAGASASTLASGRPPFADPALPGGGAPDIFLPPGVDAVAEAEAEAAEAAEAAAMRRQRRRPRRRGVGKAS